MRNIILFIVILAIFIFTGFQFYKIIKQYKVAANPQKFALKNYTVTKNSEKSNTKYGNTYTTKMINGNNVITITWMKRFDWDCNGPRKTINDISFCYYQRSEVQNDYDLIIYDKGASTYQIYTNVKELNNADLEKISTNL